MQASMLLFCILVFPAFTLLQLSIQVLNFSHYWYIQNCNSFVFSYKYKYLSTKYLAFGVDCTSKNV